MSRLLAAEDRHARQVASAFGLQLDVIAGELEPWHPEDDLRTSVVPYLTPPALAADTALARLAAAEVNVDSSDFGHLAGMVNATETELQRAGVTDTPEVAVADAGYWHQKQMESVINKGIQVLIPPG